MVNEQFLVEEIYERELALAEEYERERMNGTTQPNVMSCSNCGAHSHNDIILL